MIFLFTLFVLGNRGFPLIASTSLVYLTLSSPIDIVEVTHA